MKLYIRHGEHMVHLGQQCRAYYDCKKWLKQLGHEDSMYKVRSNSESYTIHENGLELLRFELILIEPFILVKTNILLLKKVVTVFSWLRIHCQLIDFHRPTSPDGRHTALFNWVLKYFSESKVHTPPLYLQHQGSAAYFTTSNINEKIYH